MGAGSMVFPILVSFALKEDQHLWFVAMLAVAVFSALTIFLQFQFTRERVTEEQMEGAGVKEEKVKTASLREQLAAVAGECRDESLIRKTETFNEAYRLREKGAVLNWFDITAPEGYYSLNDKLSEIVKSAEGRTVVQELMSGVMSRMGGGNEGETEASLQNAEKMMEMMGSFTAIRLMNLMGATGSGLTKEEMLAVNERLNRIKKCGS